MFGGWVKIIHNGMESVYLIEAQYRGGYRIFLRFNTGEAGEVDLEVAHQYQAAELIRDKGRFAAFYLDAWPTLAWVCGFDVAPEALYFMTTGKSRFCSLPKV